VALTRLGTPTTLQLPIPGPVEVVAFSADGERLAAAGRAIRVWATASPATAFEVAVGARALALSRSGQTVAAGVENEVIVWEVASGEVLLRDEHNDQVWAVALGDDHLVAGASTECRVHRIGTKGLVTSVGHEGDPVLPCIAFTPDLLCLVTGARDGGVRSWSLPDGPEVARTNVSASVSCLAFPGRQLLLVGSHAGTVALLDAVGRREAHRRVLCSLFATAVTRAGGQPTESDDPYARVLRDHVLSRRGGVLAVPARDGVVMLEPGSGRVGSVPVSADSVWLDEAGRRALLVHQRQVTLVDVGSNDAIGRWELPDGTRPIVMTADHVFCWSERTESMERRESSTGGLVSSSPGPRPGIVAVSQDGGQLACTVVPSAADQIAVYRTDSWRTTMIQHPVLGPQMMVQDLAFSPAGDRLVSCASDGACIVWDPVSGREILRLDQEVGVRAVAFSSTGEHLGMACMDGSVRLWQLAERIDEVARLRCRGSPSSIGFAAGDSHLITLSGQEPEIHLWRPHDLAAATAESLTRDLTDQEWRRFLPDTPRRGTRAAAAGRPTNPSNPGGDGDLRIPDPPTELLIPNYTELGRRGL
jgi:WD40 repeat protein